MMHLYQLKRRLAPLGVDLRQSKLSVQGPDGEYRFWYFVYDGKLAETTCVRESDMLSYAEVRRIERQLGLDVF